jgi:hypothetical protein
MTDYKFLNLNMFMQPENSPITQMSGQVSAYDFDWINERGAITTSMVKFLSADKLSAGVVTVSMNLGSATSGTVILDGANNRIVVHDGTTNRIVIGEV